jgi:hypothetical protein
MTPQLIANAAGIASILLVLFASPLLLGCYVVIQRSGVITQLIFLTGVVVLLLGALVFGAAGLLLLG